MKSVFSVFAMAVAGALLALPGAATAQCPPGQLDYDFALGTFETLLGTVLVDTEGNNLWDAAENPIWQQVPGQQGPGFLDVDNTGNGIDDDDHYDLLAAIIDGDESVVGGLDPGTVATIRAAFAANVATVQQQEITITGVNVNAVALGFININETISVTTGAEACLPVPFIGPQCFDVPSLWSINEGGGEGLLASASPALEGQLINLSAAVMTIGDPAGVEYYQALLAQVTLSFIEALLPALLDELKDGEKYTVPCGSIETISVDVTLTDPVAVTGTITVPAANICAALQNFVNKFNCTTFNCQTSLLAASGDLNGDATTNGASYAASADRQDWMAAESISNPPLEIWSRPVDTTVVVGTSTSFSAGVVGGDVDGVLSHEWQAIDLDDLTTIGVLAADETLAYPYPLVSDSAVLVYQVCDGLWQRRSKPAIFTVLPDVFQIVEQPVGALDIPPQDFELSVVVIGGAAVPAYQWQFDDGNGFEDIVGANGPVLAFTPLTVADSGDYRCVIDGDDGEAKAPQQLISDTATITVDPGLRISAQPQGGGVYVGGNFTFTVETDGDVAGVVAYQWRFDDGGGFQDIPGAESDSLTIDPATLADNGIYQVVVSDDDRTLFSSGASLEVAEFMEITEQPVGGTFLTGQAANLVFGISGGLGGVNYQWFKNDEAVGGATSATLTLNPVDFDDAATYRCEATDATETLVSDDAVVEVANAFNFLVQPVGAARWVGDSYTFTVEVDDGTPPFSYQWRRNGEPVGDDSPTLELTDITLADAGTYVCEVEDQNGGAQSNAAILQVGEPLEFVSEPSNAGVYVGSPHTFSTEVQGGVGTINYVWRFGSFNLGTNASSYTIASAQIINQGNYTVTVSDARGQIVSAPATLTVAQPLQFTTQPQGGFRFEGASISMSVAVSQGLGPKSYAWFKDGEPLGVTSATLNLTNLVCADAGAYYCEVTDNIATTQSDAADLVVFPAPTGVIPVGLAMDGTQVVPVNASIGTGFGNGQLQLVEGPSQNFNLSLAVNVLDVTISGVTINRGAVGANGAVIFDLEQQGNSFTVFRTLTNAQAAEMVGGLYYMVVKSPLFPNGEIRGQFDAVYDTNCPEPEGEGEGTPEGEGEGTPEGEGEGTPEGEGEGTPEGEGEGTPEGEGEGTPEGEGEGTPEGEGEGTPEGEGEGTPEGEGEGTPEGEGEGTPEGEGDPGPTNHSADPNDDGVISLSELLRVIQFYNSDGLSCDAGSEDGFAPGPGDRTCAPHASDYNPQDWAISLSELLRLIQFYNSGGYHPCEEGEDGFCPGIA